MAPLVLTLVQTVSCTILLTLYDYRNGLVSMGGCGGGAGRFSLTTHLWSFVVLRLNSEKIVAPRFGGEGLKVDRDLARSCF